MISLGTGCWMSHLEFDGFVYWRITDPPLPWKKADCSLPSDANKRPELQFMEIDEHRA